MFPSISSPLPRHSSRHSGGLLLLRAPLPRDEAGAGAPGAAQARLQTAGTRRRGAHARPPGANLPKLEVRHDISQKKHGEKVNDNVSLLRARIFVPVFFQLHGGEGGASEEDFTVVNIK